MVTTQPNDLYEWQLHRVLERASLLQYYDSFIKQGECDMIYLSHAEEVEFRDIMKKVGMAKIPLHVSHFKNTLLEWVKDPGKDTDVPSYMKNVESTGTAKAARSMQPRTVSERSSMTTEKRTLPTKHDTFQEDQAGPIKGKDAHAAIYTKTTRDSMVTPAAHVGVSSVVPGKLSGVHTLTKLSSPKQKKERKGFLIYTSEIKTLPFMPDKKVEHSKNLMEGKDTRVYEPDSTKSVQSPMSNVESERSSEVLNPPTHFHGNQAKEKEALLITTSEIKELTCMHDKQLEHSQNMQNVVDEKDRHTHKDIGKSDSATSTAVPDQIPSVEYVRLSEVQRRPLHFNEDLQKEKEVILIKTSERQHYLPFIHEIKQGHSQHVVEGNDTLEYENTNKPDSTISTVVQSLMCSVESERSSEVPRQSTQFQGNQPKEKDLLLINTSERTEIPAIHDKKQENAQNVVEGMDTCVYEDTTKTDCTLSMAAQSLISSIETERSSVVSQPPTHFQENQPKEKEILSLNTLENKEIVFHHDSKQKQTLSVPKGKDQRISFYTNTANESAKSPVLRSMQSSPVPAWSTGETQLKTQLYEEQKTEKEDILVDTPVTKHNKIQSGIKDSNRRHHEFLHSYDDLVYHTELDKIVLDNLISRCILMLDDREEIIKSTTQAERNKVLLDILNERPYGTFQLFKDVLLESEPDNSHIEELVSRMQCIESIEEYGSCFVNDILLNEYMVKIQKNYKMFVHDVDCKTDVVDYLYQTSIINTEEKEEICSSTLTRHDSNRLLCNKLFHKGEDAYTKLLEALRKGSFDELACTMETTHVSEHEQQLCKIGMKKLRERTNHKDSQMIYARIQEIERTQEAVIPKNIQEQFERRLKQWKEDDKKFVSTKAEKKVMQSILSENVVTIVGNSGTGKSFLSKHVALKMMDQGYVVIPCNHPEDIRQWFKHGANTLFVFDDVCGKYTIKKQIVDDWKQSLEHIKSLLEDKCCKIISTCRLDVYKDEAISSLYIFKRFNIDLSSEEYRLNSNEKVALAKVYCNENADEAVHLSDKWDFFPLLCSFYQQKNLNAKVEVGSFFSNPFEVFQVELDAMRFEGEGGKIKFCSLVLCVISNNTLTEENLSLKDKDVEPVIEDLMNKCEMNKGTPMESLRKSLETLEGTYVVKEDSTYKIIHDKLFDFLAKYFGEKMLQIFIDHTNADFICERFLWKTADNLGRDIEFTIQIHDNLIDRYINRLLKDWEAGYVENVFVNRNMNSPTFTEKFINCVNNLDLSNQGKLVCTVDINSKDTALAGSCYVGSVNLVKWLISRKSDINQCGQDGFSPLLWASQEGHLEVVKELLQFQAEINKCDEKGVSPLWIASQNGHVDVVKELLQHSAEVNICSNDGTPPLQIACYNNRIEVVNELLRHDSVDINLCDSHGCSSLFWASQQGFCEVVNLLLQYSAEVDKSNRKGESPLWIASQEGHVNVVHKLFQHSGDVNKCRNDGIPPLSRASFFNKEEVVNELLRCGGVDIDLCDDDGCSPLYLASQKGLTHIVKLFLKYSADVNKCSSEGTSPLSSASYLNQIEVVNVLLQNNVKIDLSDNDGRSPLYWASKQGHADVVKILIDHSANVNKCNKKSESPLWKASQYGHDNIVKQLLLHSANINGCSNDGTSPLPIACINNMVETVKVLLKHGDVAIDLCDNNECSSLYWASLQGHRNVVKELLQQSVDVNKSNHKGESPLWIASQEGHSAVIEYLIHSSADVNKCRSDHISPLARASYCNQIEAVNVLLKSHDIDIHICDTDGCSALYLACQFGFDDIVKKLLQHSAKVNKYDNNGVSPLWIACQEGHVNIVKELLQHSADVNMCDKDQTSPLWISSQNGHVEIVNELLQHASDVNVTDSEGISPLLIASESGHTHVVKELLKHLADVNACDNQGVSPLWVASYHGHSNVVKELLKHSANVNSIDEQGTTPLDVAKKNKHEDVIVLLLGTKEM